MINKQKAENNLEIREETRVRTTPKRWVLRYNSQAMGLIHCN